MSFKLPPLHSAITDQAVDLVSTLIADGADVNEADCNSCTPLHAAVDKDNIEIATMLIRAGANVNAEDFCTMTPLCCATSTEMIDLLVDNGATVDHSCHVDDYIHSVLTGKIRDDRWDLAKRLLERGASPNYSNPKEYKPLQHVALRPDHPERMAVAKMLIDMGADVNAHRHDQPSALCNAVEFDDVELATLLLKSGANPSVLMTSHTKPDPRNGDILRAHPLMVSPLWLAVERYNRDMVRLLLDNGACIDHRYSNRWTIMHLAAHEGNPDMFWTLNAREPHCSVEDRNRDGETPLFVAVRNNRISAVHELIQLGADVNAKSKHGKTPLDIARELGVDCEHLLLPSVN